VTETRTRLLAAATEVIARQGSKDLTLQAVAREAGVSKGGLLYHFPTKAALVQALVGQAVDEVDSFLAAAVATDFSPGAFSRAYVGVTMAPDDAGAGATLATALLATAASDPHLLQPLRDAYERWNDSLRADGLPPGIALVIRLAADGWWLAHITGLGTLAAQEDVVVTRTLLELAGETA
jgi:AcrR family transcriptional regulator